MTAAAPQITLNWPHDPAFRPVGRLVLGGVAARLDVPVDRVEELGLALDSLARCAVDDGRLQLEVGVGADRLSVTVGNFVADPLADPAIRRVVVRLVDEVESAGTPAGHRVVLRTVISPQPAG